MRTIVELHPQWNFHGKIREAGDIAMVHLLDWSDQLVKFIGLLGEQSAEILPYFSNCTLLGWAYNQRFSEGRVPNSLRYFLPQGIWKLGTSFFHEFLRNWGILYFFPRGRRKEN